VKPIEAAAAGLPIVAFAESVQGTTFRDDDHLLVADKTLAALAETLGRILHDPDTAGRLGSGARAHAVEHHDWEGIARIVETELMRLTGAGPP
jgi:glycosyltransferase involved in cell wall biosynthesis